MAFNSYSRNDIDIQVLLAQMGQNQEENLIDLVVDPEQETPIDHQALRIKYAHKPELGRRVAPRLDVALEVIIMSPARSFRTQTANISESGLLLQDPVPGFITKNPFEIILKFRDPQDAGKKETFVFQGQSADMFGQASSRIELLKSFGNSSQRLYQLMERYTAVPS